MTPLSPNLESVDIIRALCKPPPGHLSPCIPLLSLPLHNPLHPLRPRRIRTPPIQMRARQMLHPHKFQPSKEIRWRIPYHGATENTLLATPTADAVARIRLVDVAAAVIPDTRPAARFGAEFAYFGGAGDGGVGGGLETGGGRVVGVGVG